MEKLRSSLSPGVPLPARGAPCSSRGASMGRRCAERSRTRRRQGTRVSQKSNAGAAGAARLSGRRRGAGERAEGPERHKWQIGEDGRAGPRRVKLRSDSAPAHGRPSAKVMERPTMARGPCGRSIDVHELAASAGREQGGGARARGGPQPRGLARRCAPDELSNWTALWAHASEGSRGLRPGAGTMQVHDVDPLLVRPTSVPGCRNLPSAGCAPP